MSMETPDHFKKRVKVMFAVPSRDVWKSDFGMSLAAMAAATVSEMPNVDIIFNNAKGATLSMNRIKLCKRAIEAGCDYILFLDDDMRIPMHTFMMLYARRRNIIGANCARRELPPYPTAKGFDGKMVYTTNASSGVEEVKSVGTGVMLINTDVLKNLPQPWFMEDPIQEIGEDVYFCNLARKHGFSVYIDHDISKEVVHMGEFEYRHQIMEQWDKEDVGKPPSIERVN